MFEGLSEVFTPYVLLDLGQKGALLIAWVLLVAGLISLGERLLAPQRAK